MTKLRAWAGGATLLAAVAASWVAPSGAQAFLCHGAVYPPVFANQPGVVKARLDFFSCTPDVVSKGGGTFIYRGTSLRGQGFPSSTGPFDYTYTTYGDCITGTYTYFQATSLTVQGPNAVRANGSPASAPRNVGCTAARAVPILSSITAPLLTASNGTIAIFVPADDGTTYFTIGA